MNETGITVIALDIQNKHKIILATQNIVGFNLVNPSVVFKNPFEAIPVIIASIK